MTLMICIPMWGSRILYVKNGVETKNIYIGLLTLTIKMAERLLAKTW